MNKLKPFSLLLLLTSPILCMDNCANIGGHSNNTTNNIKKSKTLLSSKNKNESAEAGGGEPTEKFELNALSDDTLSIILFHVPNLGEISKTCKRIQKLSMETTKKKLLQIWPEIHPFISGLIEIDQIIGQDATAEEILKWCTNPKNKQSLDQALIIATKNNLPEFINYLLTAGANINAIDIDGETALTGAIQLNNAEIIMTLLNLGINVNSTNRYGYTSITLAAYLGSAKILRILLNSGADPNTVDGNGNTALMLAEKGKRTEIRNELLMAGANADTCK